MPFTAESTRQQPFGVTFLIGINIAMAAALVFAWPTLAPRLAAPFGWAFGHTISTQLSIWEVPFLLMWLIPLLLAMMGHLLDGYEQTGWAYVALMIPLVTLTATISLFRVFG
jgi:hypothetical protein